MKRVLNTILTFARMENSELQFLLDTLNKDLEFYKAHLKEVAEEMIQENFTQYPIFIAHQHTLSLGELLFDKDEYQRSWSIHASTMEELSEKGLIAPDKKSEFIKTFKDPKKYLGLLMITPGNANFAFVKY